MTDIANSFVEKILAELGRVRSGTSKHVSGAITFEATKLPFAQLLQRYKDDPTNTGLLKMLVAAGEQDFGHRFGMFVQEAVNDVRRASGESVPLPVVPAPTSLFNQELYNQLSTILQYTIGRQLDAKQIERLQFDTARLASVLTKQIDEQASAKATAICKVLAKVIGDEIEELRANMDLPVRRQRDIPHGPYDAFVVPTIKADYRSVGE